MVVFESSIRPETWILSAAYTRNRNGIPAYSLGILKRLQGNLNIRGWNPPCLKRRNLKMCTPGTWGPSWPLWWSARPLTAATCLILQLTSCSRCKRLLMKITRRVTWLVEIAAHPDSEYDHWRSLSPSVRPSLSSTWEHTTVIKALNKTVD